MSLVGEEGYEYHLLIHRDSEGNEMPGRRDEMQSNGSEKLPSGFGETLQLGRLKEGRKFAGEEQNVETGEPDG